MTRKPKRAGCVSCKRSSELTTKDRAVIKRARDTEPSMNSLVRRYGALGVLQLLALTYTGMHDKSGDEVEHDAAALIGEFADIFRRRITEKNVRLPVRDKAE